MNRDELIQRISEALDSPDGIEGDLELQRIFVRDADASDLADEMARADAALRAWPQPQRTEEGWNALATRIEQRLDEALPAMGDPTAPPALEDDEAPPRPDGEDAERSDRPVARPAAHADRPRTSSGEFSLDLLTKKQADAETLPGEDRFSFSELAVAPPRVGGGAPGFIDVGGAPPAERERRRGGWWIAGGLAAAAAVGLAVVAGVGTFAGDEEQTVASAPVEQAADPAGGEAWGADDVPPPAEEPELEAAAVAEEAAAEVAAPEGEPAEEEAEEAAAARQLERAAPARRRASASPGRPAYRAPRAARPSRTASTEMESPTRPSSGGTAGGAGGSTSTELPETPTREQVVRAMDAVKPMVESCAGERSGVVQVEITVGSSGRVRSAQVTGYFAGTPEGSCVARAVRRARLPEFSQETFSFTYPFSI